VFFYNLFKGVSPLFPLYIVFLPLLIVLTFIFTAGFVLLFSHLQVFYRDVRYIVEVLLLVWFYLSGVFFQIDTVASGAAKRGIPWLTKLFILNPLYDLLTLYRVAVLPQETGMAIVISDYYNPWLLTLQLVLFSCVFFMISYHMFLKKEKDLVDFI
jgi:ABC-type polysaccharide/polyol phosphate export permease